ncbi:peroxidase-like [Phlebotomus argentipes]|uniref:peroxidase-like n=1 Tax=Phlebotomus argentipes TaxID=94469 RepID=UPI002892E4A2|nr:peroxidase-like [Phlebotomus argentipes]
MNSVLLVLLTAGLFAGGFCFKTYNPADLRLVLEAYRNATKMQNMQEMLEKHLCDLKIEMRPEDIGFRQFRNFGQFLSMDTREAFRVSKILLKAGQYLHRVFYSNVTKTELSEKDFYTWLHDLSHYVPPIRDTARWKLSCDPKAMYRSINGTCTHAKDPNAGSTLTSFSRITLPVYDDDIHIVRRDADYRTLPLARNIVVYLFLNYSPFANTVDQLDFDNIPNVAGLMFGQVIAHDMTQKLNVQNLCSENGIQCCARRNSRVLPADELHSACTPIQLSPRDPIFGPANVGCVNLIRSETISRYGKTLSAAQQVNRATSALDLSVIYGSSDVDAKTFRTFQGGKLIMSADNILPEVANCTTNACYRIGDSRVNQTPFLAIQYSLFARHHNRVAVILSTLNSHWKDKKIFQETRRILIAQYQHVIFNEFLPAWGLAEDDDPEDLADPADPAVADTEVTAEPEDEHVKAITVNEFATAAFRIFHMFIPDQYMLLNAQNVINSFRLSDTIFNSTLIRSFYEDILRGMLNQQSNLQGFGDEVLNRLFKNLETDLGIDLMATDIIRGRDHGLNPYLKYVEFCGTCANQTITRFDELGCLFDFQNIARLQRVYRSVQDIDLMVGGALENAGSELIGPTFQCIIREQFRRTRLGDRFFYNLTDSAYPFTNDQLNEIRKFTAAHLYCGNSNIERTPTRAFITPRREADFVLCRDLPRLEYSAWRESRP